MAPGQVSLLQLHDICGLNNCGRYLRSFAAFVGLAADEDYAGQGLPDIVSYNTRVEHIEKDSNGKWVHTLKRVVPQGEDGYREDWWQEATDAVVSSI
jgi:hypothetical protein